MKDSIQVAVVFADAERQEMVSVRLAPGASVAEAIQASGLITEFPVIDLSKNKVGIFGKIVRLDTKLRAGDRVEIYRALALDPKEIRRLRALRGRAKSKA